jgi:hypothetical protein
MGVDDDAGAAAAPDVEIPVELLELAADAETVTVPFIHGWNEQWKVNVPAFANVTSFDSPALIAPVSNELSSAVAVCGCAPVFWNETLSPTFTVMSAGSNFHAVCGSPCPSTDLTTFAAPPAAVAEAVGLDAAPAAPLAPVVALGDGFDEPP